jgi:two-component system phosphate regulon sensor histidine kinase PhoR
MNYERITTDSAIVKDRATIRDTQIPVVEVLNRLAEGATPDQVVAQLPGLELADIQATLRYAASALAERPELVRPDRRLSNERASDQTPVELDLKKILVVDDLEENRFLIKTMFRSSGFTLIMASEASEALAKARAELPVLVISDIQMPNMTGFELLTTLKADERTKNIAVILVSAHHRTANQVSQGLIMGADDYIYRPFVRDEFMSRVEAVMRVKWAEAETRRQARVIAQRNKDLELVNELALTVNSSLDLQEIFASAMQKLSQLLAVEAVAIILFNQDKGQMVVNISSGSGKRVLAPISFKSLVESDNKMVMGQVSDIVLEVFNNRHLDLGVAPISNPGAIQSIPLLSKEQKMGAIAIIDRAGISLAEAERVLLRSAGSIIAVAVENAHLLESAQRQVDDLIALNEIGRALTSTLDLEQTLKQTTLFMQRSLECEAASLWLLDESRQELVLTTASGVGSEAVTGFRLPMGRGVAGYVARTGNSYIAADLSKDEYHFTNVPNMNNYRPSSILSTPIQYKDRIIGVMQALHQKKNWFDQEHLRLSSPVANFVGIAIENARLFREVQDFNRQLEQMVMERTRELAEEKEKTEAILASMADGLLVLDAEKSILMANAVAERMLDFRLSELAGKPIGLKQLENPLWSCIHAMTDHDELTSSFEVDVPDAQSGALLSIQAHSAKVRHESDQIVGTVIVLRDITALKEVERIKARFMAGVTHELKTPLSVIRLHSKNLLSYYHRLPEAKRNELLSSIQSQAALLGQLIEGILELSRLDAGMDESDHQALDCAMLVERIAAELRPLAEAKRITLTCLKAADRVMIVADPGQIERVTRNLIDNAIKYTRAGGSVVIKVASELDNGREFAVIQVSDTGIGISPEHQARIFERFYRVDPSHTIPGTGLGLSIVKEIVNAHGGHIQLDSSSGAGSTFIVRLPGVVRADAPGGV